MFIKGVSGTLNKTALLRFKKLHIQYLQNIYKKLGMFNVYNFICLNLVHIKLLRP